MNVLTRTLIVAALAGHIGLVASGADARPGGAAPGPAPAPAPAASRGARAEGTAPMA